VVRRSIPDQEFAQEFITPPYTVTALDGTMTVA
jgi:hypothetical protein